ncbi:hypothetical protein NIES267_38210 [Calothrix parasitica NIES-267]|uniref:Uncharacterized protein n=1 Tax=Calothrix parasitica NIES-267 TaxID=1973488 RepID=A0A1Z4LSU8_9CYAN|nr:hypothetical protein NIES267_38210 [Calothrix parasitica NIES-267]
MVSQLIKGTLSLGILYIMHKIAIDDNTQNVYPPFIFATNFDYSQFENSELQSKAKITLNQFIGFVRQTFDGLLENGQALNSIYQDCIANSSKGKKVFDNWLASDDFGASRYIAKAAIEIYNWFSKLPKRLQRLVRNNVQKWSVSALRQLTKVSHDLVKELVRSGKKTALQVKEEREKNERESERVREGEKEQSLTPTSLTPSLLAPGTRIVVKSSDRGWTDYAGIIMSEWKGDFWVLLDHVVAQGMDVKQLFKPHQIQPESLGSDIKQASLKDMFSAAQVENKIAEALQQREKERAEEAVGKFVEIRDAALLAAKEEIIAAQKHAQKMEQAKHELIEQLIAKENELQSVRGLVDTNQQLQQRIEDLEKALEDSNKDSWGNTFNKQAAKVVNKELEKTIEPLMSEVERLNNVLSQREQELTQAKATSRKQLKELQHKSKFPSVITEFGSLGEYLGWNGWSSKGYRTQNGTLYTGIHALTAFICDLKVSHPSYQEQEIPF